MAGIKYFLSQIFLFVLDWLFWQFVTKHYLKNRYNYFIVNQQLAYKYVVLCFILLYMLKFKVPIL